MQLRLQSRYLVLLFSLSFLFSCKKDDSPTTIIVTEEKTPLFQQIQGKWVAEIEYLGRVSNFAINKKPDFSAKVQDMPQVSSVEFFSDSTYVLVFGGYRGYTSKFNVKDTNTLHSAELGDISNVKIKGDSISFTFLYFETEVSVKAARSNNTNVAGDKQAIVNEWSLVDYEEGTSTIGNWGENVNISFLFTNSGTFGVKYASGDEYNLQVMEWKWKPGKVGEIIYYGMGNLTDGNYYSNVYIKVVELTFTSLKVEMITLQNEYDEDENVIGTKESINLTLTFAAK